MKTGDVVRVRFFGGLVEKRIVVQVEDNTVIICNVPEWESATKEKRMPDGIRVQIYDLEECYEISTDIHTFAQF